MEPRLPTIQKNNLCFQHAMRCRGRTTGNSICFLIHVQMRENEMLYPGISNFEATTRIFDLEISIFRRRNFVENFFSKNSFLGRANRERARTRQTDRDRDRQRQTDTRARKAIRFILANEVQCFTFAMSGPSEWYNGLPPITK